MIKVGRYTAALLLVAVGGLLLLDQMMDTNLLGMLLDWWPLLLISLGVEYLLINLWTRSEERQMKLDFGGVFIALLISVIVVGVTQASSLSLKLFDDFHINVSPFSFSDENGRRFDKGVTKVPLDPQTQKVIVKNPNGSVIVKAGDVEQIEVDVTVWVSKVKDKEAETIAENSKIEFTEGSTLKIVAKGEVYRGLGKQKPRMNLSVTVPKSHQVDMELQLTNGKVEVSQLTVKDELKIQTSNGSIKLTDIDGNVKVDTSNGAVTVENITGDLHMETTNGALSAQHVDGKVEADTTNGKIILKEIEKDINADTSNGGIYVSSAVVGGNWKLDTTVGEIEIYVAENGDYKVKGSSGFGTITTDFPLSVTKKTIEGTIGSGQYEIHLDSNGSISVNKLQQP